MRTGGFGWKKKPFYDTGIMFDTEIFFVSKFIWGQRNPKPALRMPTYRADMGQSDIRDHQYNAKDPKKREKSPTIANYMYWETYKTEIVQSPENRNRPSRVK